MAILDNIPSILLIALDRADAEGEPEADGNVNASSNNGGLLTEKQIIEADQFLDRLLQTDGYNKQIRIPIPISDKVIPAHHVGNASNMNKFVDYDNDKIAIEPSSNGISLQFELKNNLTGLSTAADIFMALAGKSTALFTATPRVSFIGSNIAVFNAYLTGLTKQTVRGADKELINLQLDYADPDAKPSEQKNESVVFERSSSAGG